MDRDRHVEPNRNAFTRPLSRRGLLKGLAALMTAGAVAPLAAACAQQQPAAPKPAEPAAKVDSQPAAGQPAPKTEAQPAAAAKPAAGEPRRGGTLKIAVIGEPPALDPTFTTATITQNVTWHVFEPLFTRSEKGEAVPLLVDTYEAANNGQSWTFSLRKGVPFHNDKEMTSADVVASLKRWMGMSGRGRYIGRRVDSIDAREKYTVAMTFKEPTGVLPIFLAKQDAIVIPEDVANAFAKDKLTEWVGTGPYRHLEHLPDRHVRYGRWDKYVPLESTADGAGGKRVAYIDELLFIPAPEGSVRADGVGTNEYQFAENLEPDQFDMIKAQPNVTPIVVKPNYWYTAHFNKKEGLFTNQKLRQAVLASLSMDPIMKAGWGRQDFYRLGPEIAAPETAWYTDVGKDVYDKPDPDKARRLMQEAGYDGTPIRWMSTKEYFYNYNMALPMKQQLEAAGFKVDLQVMDCATLVKRRADSKEYDVFVTGHPSYDHPVLQVYRWAGWPGWWVSEEKDRIVNGIMSESDG